MLVLTNIVRTFPSARIPSECGGVPIEVTLIALLGHGAGDGLFASAMRRQRGHAQFLDELDEPSARLGAMHLAQGDTTALYSFGVGHQGHPFHRHAGHRVFTAVSGSGGAQLRFSTASAAQIAADPEAFFRALRFVEVPADCLFTVRFGGETWHQFAPKDSSHPAFFAVSCHTNELGGTLPADVRAKILANEASIPALTELLPENVEALLRSSQTNFRRVPTIALALDAPAGGLHSRFCSWYRGGLGRLRGSVSHARSTDGFISSNATGRDVRVLHEALKGSLLAAQFTDGFHHEDNFTLTIAAGHVATRSASQWLERLLDGFLENRPLGVTRLMAFRNWLVQPLGLRTSPLGCPASSLLNASTRRFARFPVLDSAINDRDMHAQVILGADDKHLAFRSSAAVSVNEHGAVTFSLGTRVRCKNVFGRAYMAAISSVHRRYVGPAMLAFAVDWATR